MFGNRDIPFQGDYNWVAVADANGATAGGLFAYLAWTDNREVVDGADPRETQAQPGSTTGSTFCSVGSTWVRRLRAEPRHTARQADAPFSGDNCGNAGGLDQDIFGIVWTASADFVCEPAGDFVCGRLREPALPHRTVVPTR